jgi:2-oxoisovalerate dehydrogenase E1 component alpha subunit
VTYGSLSEGPRLNPDLMFDDVFKEMPQNLQRQRDQMRAERG